MVRMPGGWVRGHLRALALGVAALEDVGGVLQDFPSWTRRLLDSCLCSIR